MRNILKSLLEHEKVQAVQRLLAGYWAPVHATWLQVTAPLRTALQPLTDAWAKFTAPARARWAVFAQRNPLPATVLSWSGQLFKWGFGFLLALAAAVGIGVFGHIPSSEELQNIETANATEIYTADSVLIGRYYLVNRTTIALDKISPHVINALVATEDHRFFEHSGIDFTSWLRVGYGMLTRKGSGGGSTLSQQLAKNLYPRKHYGIPGLSLLINKIRENYISVKLEKIYSKPELLNLYLNTVPFGGDIYGISVASRHYFGKKAKELSPDQAATLIGMLKATTYYNPVRNPENAKKRRNVVLNQMLKNKHLTQEEYETLSKKPIGAKRNANDGNNDGPATYFREYLRTDVMPQILKKHPKDDGTPYNLYTDGLKIYTTLNSKMQGYAEQAVAEHMLSLQTAFDKHWMSYKSEKPWGDDKWILDQIHRSDRWAILKESGLSDSLALANFEQKTPMTIFVMEKGGAERDTVMTPIDSVRHYFCLLNCGFMAMDHSNGYVRAWVGGTNFKYFKFDHIKSRRQVGSTFKPIVYAAALQKGVKPCDFYSNQMVTLGDWEPHNSDDTYGGWYSVTGALTNSVNVVAAQLIEKAGIEATIQMAKKMGISTKLPREFGISLGAAEVSLYEMDQVYGTIGNKGVHTDPVTVLKVVTHEGDVVYDYKSEEKPEAVHALTENEAATMTRMLQNVIDHGTGSRLRRGYAVQGDFAGKTGTTQNQADGWFICFNPQLVTGAWVGAESPAVRFRSMALGQGASMALPIVALFWHKMANDRKFGKMLQEKFPEPKPEVAELFGCPFYIGINPDTFNLMMQDSVLRDSMVANGYKDLKILQDTYFGTGEGEIKEEKPETDNKGIKIFEKLLGRKQEEPPEKDKKDPGKNKN